MIKRSHTIGIEINPKQLGVLLTDRVANTLRIFCFYTNGSISQINVPAEENIESQRALFSDLNIEPTCTSVILDAAVQGRVYVQSGGQHWLYTVLNTPGNRLPLNADIGDLPWEVLWHSQEMEALKYRPADGTEPSFVLRNKIIESDDRQLAKKIKMFTHPVSPSQKVPHRWSYMGIGIMLLAVAVVVAGTLYYTFRQNKLAARSVPALNTEMTEAAAPATGKYFLLYSHQISGPFPAKIVADMEAAGLFSPDTMCRAGGSTVWVKLATAFPSKSHTN